MSDKNLYSILGVERDANDNQIRKAYKRLAMRHHPDRNKSADAENKFKEIQSAYNVLSDEEKRAMYDRFGTVDHAQINGQAQPDFSEIFDHVFGGFSDRANRQHSTTPHRGQDILVSLILDLEDAVKGCQRKIKVTANAKCNDCSGTGMHKDSKRADCSRCQGKGYIRNQVAFFSMQETCAKCQGTGTIIQNPCRGCKGTGRTRQARIVDIKVPAGIDHGDRLRVNNEGEAGMSGEPAGDLLVEVSFNQHPLFVRNGNDIHCEMPIQFTTAALGGKVNIPTLDGLHEFTLPQGVQSNTTVRIRGKGVQGLRSDKRGDLFCKIIVETPQDLNAAQIKLLQQLDETLNSNPTKHSPSRTSWAAKAKKFFS